ncbi:hypothetical protein AB0K15_25350 [Amycolatopsis sp. NPDC049253]|uniref:hypothetical protein n=1 Tax=Amycolatopsis sp. NPDC049253 TaxID=3155274 RepID=UPI003424B2E9
MTKTARYWAAFNQFALTMNKIHSTTAMSVWPAAKTRSCLVRRFFSPLTQRSPLLAASDLLVSSPLCAAGAYKRRCADEVVTGIADQVGNFLWNDSPQQEPPAEPADVASLIDQLQQLLDAAKSSGHSGGDDTPGLRAVV